MSEEWQRSTTLAIVHGQNRPAVYFDPSFDPICGLRAKTPAAKIHFLLLNNLEAL